MKFVLIVLLSSMGGGGMNQWRQPAMTSALFDDRAACESAAETIKGEMGKLAREARIEYPAMSAMCFAASTKDIKQ